MARRLRRLHGTEVAGARVVLALDLILNVLRVPRNVLPGLGRTSAFFIGGGIVRQHRGSRAGPRVRGGLWYRADERRAVAPGLPRGRHLKVFRLDSRKKDRKFIFLEKRTDVFVIGGGPAGLAAAIAARQKGFRVIVADGSAPMKTNTAEQGSRRGAAAA